MADEKMSANSSWNVLTKKELEEREEMAKRTKSIQWLFRVSTAILFLLLISFTIASSWQNRIREKEVDYLLKTFNQNLDFEGPHFSIVLSTSTKKLSKDKNDYTKVASWYDYSLPGYPEYSKNNFTAASRDYPKNTQLIVCKDEESQTLKCVQARVNDYGPDPKIHPDRSIDLSSAAFKELAPLSAGLLKVKIYTMLYVATEPLRFLDINSNQNKNEVFINPIHKEVDI